MSLQHQQLITTATIAASAVAAVGVVSLTALQSDVCSRLVLTPQQLQAKRGRSYQYTWQQAMTKQDLQLQYCWAGGVQHYDNETEQIMTDIFLTEAEIIEFIDQTLIPSVTEMVVGRIGLMEASPNNKEYYIWFYHMNQSTSRIYQLPLGMLGRLLAARLERSVTRTTFCFVADASSGAAIETLVDLVHAGAKSSSVRTVREPVWMVVLARLVEQRVLATETLDRCVFALARLEALKVVPGQNTVLMTVPQAVVPVMLPVLQQVFPDDRHVFGYTGCIPAVATALEQRAVTPRAAIPDHMSEAVRFTNPVATTTPMNATALTKSTNVMEPFAKALQALPVHMADVTETWMAAVDAFFTLKENEKKNGYLPYIFRHDYIAKKADITTTTATPEKMVVSANSDCYWSAMSLLQFVTGSRSREVTSETTDAVLSWLRDIRNPKNTKTAIAVSPRHQKSIENCVFQHKLILIAHKTLKDTVQPAQHWTLKDTTKRGCSCCAPEDEDEDEDNPSGGGASDRAAMNGTAGAGILGNSSMPLASGSGSNGSNINYVDGKSTFAFDPSKFK
jgi:hypothetical protein